MEPTMFTARLRSGTLAVALVLLAALVGLYYPVLTYLVPLPGIDRSSLFYYPYPALVWPTISPLIAAATLGLGVPAVMR